MLTLADFARIQHAGFEYKIPEASLLVLKRLASAVGTEVTPATFSKPATKHGTEKIIADIKLSLNKLSTDTFRQLMPLLCDSIASLQDPVVGATLILDTAAANAFYAQLYARVFIRLKSPEFDTLLSCYVDTHVEQIVAGDAARPFTVFIAHMVLEGGLDSTIASDLVAKLQSLIDGSASDAGAKARNEELVEHVAVLAQWLPRDRVEAMLRCAPNTHPGISFKTLFKYMDYYEKKYSKKK